MTNGGEIEHLMTRMMSMVSSLGLLNDHRSA